MGELRLEHIEADLSSRRAIPLSRDELELCPRVDEPADEPRRGHAIDVDTLSRDPDASPEVVGSEQIVRGFWNSGSLDPKPLLYVAEKTLDRLASGGPEEVDRSDFS